MPIDDRKFGFFFISITDNKRYSSRRMKLLLHTIALEPARWTPKRVSCRLIELLAPIAGAGFDCLEIYEPHLDGEAAEIRDGLESNQLQPVVLSSYLNLKPAETSDEELSQKLNILAGRIEYFGFKKLRLFAGPGMSTTDTAGITTFSARVKAIATRLPQTEVLLETHDGSLAEDPRLIVRIVEDLALPNVGLLYQPTSFTAESALGQLALQKHLIRHLHLQNRNPDGTFATLSEGVVPWDTILSELAPGVDATLEFVPAGICTVEEFSLEATLAQVCSEAEFARRFAR